MRRIGIYGGTFDPVHHAHLILARQAVEELALDQLIFVPAAMSPHKLAQHAASGEARAEMLRASVAGEERFGVDECELLRPPPSYTIETVEEFRRREPDAEFYLLIGSDNVPRLTSWHRFGELRESVTFVVLDRGEDDQE